MAIYSLILIVVTVSVLTMYLLHRYGNWRKQTHLVTLAAYLSWFFPFLIISVIPLDVCNTRYRQCIYDVAKHSGVIHTTSAVTTIATTVATTTIATAQAIVIAAEYTFSANLTMSNGTTIAAATLFPMTATPPYPHDDCLKPWSYVSDDVLPTFWHVVYWSSQILTWMLLPIMQSYARAGDFTVAGKLRSSLIENAIYYGTYLLIFSVCLIYVVLKPSIHMKVLAITASNTWGLTLLVLLLGYGLVEIPRMCWNNAKKDHRLKHTYFKIAKLSTEKSEAEENLEDILQDIKKASENIKKNHPSRGKIDTILSKCPDDMRNSALGAADNDYETYSAPNQDCPSDKVLIRLHKQVKSASLAYLRTQGQWLKLVDQAFYLEDTLTNTENTSHKFSRAFAPYRGAFKSVYTPVIEWYWRCSLLPLLQKMSTVLLTLLSVVIILSECLFFIRSPVMSLCAVFIQSARSNYFMIEMISYVVILYMCICAYHTVFKIRIFNYYYISDDHMTNENSLIFAGMLLCRLTPPLCLNFLGMIHLDSHLTKDSNILETSYTKIMGHMDVIAFIADGFNVYFPIAILLISVASYFHAGSRMLTSIGVQQFIEDDTTDDSYARELVEEGVAHIKRERRMKERNIHSDQRRKHWSNKVEVISRLAKNRIRAPVAREPVDDDRTELLRSADSLDSNSSDTRLIVNTSPEQRMQYNVSPSYQRSHGQPPRNLFDDV